MKKRFTEEQIIVILGEAERDGVVIQMSVGGTTSLSKPSFAGATNMAE